MGAIAMKPNGAMRTHNGHGVYHQKGKVEQGEIRGEEHNEEGYHTDHHDQTDGRNPIAPISKNVGSLAVFFKELLIGWFDKVPIGVCPAI